MLPNRFEQKLAKGAKGETVARLARLPLGLFVFFACFAVFCSIALHCHSRFHILRGADPRGEPL
jgi:hypothetical protein